MRKIVVSEFVSLDNVMQAPGGAEEDTEGGFTHGGWTGPFWHDDRRIQPACLPDCARQRQEAFSRGAARSSAPDRIQAVPIRRCAHALRTRMMGHQLRSMKRWRQAPRVAARYGRGKERK
jgi:hypothetical protein